MSGSGKAAVGAVAVALVLAAALSAARQGEPKAVPSAAATSDLAFLEIGKAYIIQFAPGHDPFELKTAEVVPSEMTSTAPGEKPTTQTISSTVRMTYRVPEFVVKKLGGGSWALVEYPLDVKAACERSFSRIALSNKELLAEQEKTAEGRKQIADWKKEAAQQVLTSEAWMNLTHAIVIAPPLVDPNDPRLKAVSISVDIK